MLLTLLNNRGTAELQLGRYAAASTTFSQVLDICRTTNNLHRLSSVLVNFSVIDFYLGRFGAARERCEEVLRIQAVLKNELHRAASLTNLCAVLIEEDCLEQAAESAQRALEICRRINEPVGCGELYALLARIARCERRFDQALQYCHQSIRILEPLSEKRYLATSLREMGLLHLELGNIEQACEYLRDSFTRLLQAHVLPECSKTLEALAHVALHLGNAALAVALCAAAHANRELLGTPRHPSDQRRYAETLTHAKELLWSAGFEQSWQYGLTITLEQTPALLAEFDLILAIAHF